jgi:L-lysine exporter family protein LysE/ArgO
MDAPVGTVGLVIAVSLAGFLTSLALLAVIGAQNTYLLRQGLRGSHVGAVVAVGALSDVVLIAIGVTGIGTVVDHAHWALGAVRWLGIAFLTSYAISSLARARGASAPGATPANADVRRVVVVRMAVLTWLNPHVYLDTVLLIGSLANAHGRDGRWWFGVGACSASVVWFATIGFGARLLAPYLTSRRAWNVVDIVTPLTMLFVAARLALS